MKKSTSPSRRWNRRDFLRTTTLTAGAMAFGVPTLLRGQNLNSKLNIAAIGAAGKGASDTDCCDSENIYALCDVDADICAGQRQKYPQAKFYRDFRKMFDEAGRNIDAVTVSTPDHLHAVAASVAMRLGKNVYCQKPLTQTIYEARYLHTLAHKTGVITQMGNQGSSLDGLCRAVECIQAGLIGPVRQVHVWTNRPIWPQGIGRPEGSDPVPDSLNWDLWLGPAPVRPFKKGVYHPFNWRGWQDFGTGALGDMACHTVNLPFRALGLGYPTEIEAQALGVMNAETYPLGSKIRFEFPARKFSVPAANKSFFHHHDTIEQVATTLWWYDGGQPLANNPSRHDGSNKPARDLTADVEALLGKIPGSGCLLIGDRGKVFSPDDYGEQFYVKLNDDPKFIHYQQHPALDSIPQTIPRNEFKGDTDRRHHLQWIAAIKQNNPELCCSRLAIGAPLTEIMLLGCVALRTGKKIEWDGPAMRAINAPEAAPYIKRENRAGWTLA
ncbi:MAG: Gfo/Idh/MocA family oxidoreductase [Verrucomicrobiia bacterium]